MYVYRYMKNVVNKVIVFMYLNGFSLLVIQLIEMDS